MRRKVLVIGAGSVGLDIAARLAATGMLNVDVMDFDTVESGNLDRLIGATPADARLGRAKIDVASRLMHAATTADQPSFRFYGHSVCEPDGLAIALDHDVIICCVGRPWPRIVLSQIAYSCPTCARPFHGDELERAIAAQNESLELAQDRTDVSQHDLDQLNIEIQQLAQVESGIARLAEPIAEPDRPRPTDDPDATIAAAQEVLPKHDELAGSVTSQRSAILAQLDNDDELQAASAGPGGRPR